MLRPRGDIHRYSLSPFDHYSFGSECAYLVRLALLQLFLLLCILVRIVRRFLVEHAFQLIARFGAVTLQFFNVG